MRRLIGSAVIVAVLLGSGYAALANRGPDTFTVTADVEQAPNLFEGGRVMIRGVEVGRIAEVRPRPHSVRLVMHITDGTKIPEDARLHVIPITVIADRYVQFTPAYEGGGFLNDGAHVRLERTTIPAELEDVLGQLEDLLDALGKEPGEARGPLARLVESLDRSLEGRADDLGGALDSSAVVLENLADSDEDIRQLVKNLDVLFAGLAQRSSEIGLINERFALVAESLKSDQDDIEGTIENLALLSEEASGLIDESGNDLGRSFGRLGRVLKTILEHQDELTTATHWSNVIARSLGATDGSGRGLYAYTGKQAPVGSLGAAYNYRIDTRDTISCRRLEELVYSLTAFNPAATTEGLTNTALSFMAPEYQDDLRYLVHTLIPLCAVYPNNPIPENRPNAIRAKETVEALERGLGEAQLRELLTGWLDPEAGP